VIGDRLGLFKVREVPRAGNDDRFAEAGEVFRQEPTESVPGDPGPRRPGGRVPGDPVDAPPAI